MSFIEKNLADKEQIIFKTTLHWIIFMPVFLLLICFLAASIYSHNRYAYYAGLAISVLAILSFIEIMVRLTSSEYAVTSRRIIMKHGFLSRSFFAIDLRQVETIEADSTLFGKMFNYGTLIIKGTGGTREIFTNISKPLYFIKCYTNQKEAV